MFGFLWNKIPQSEGGLAENRVVHSLLHPVPLCHEGQRSRLCSIFIPTQFNARYEKGKAISRQKKRTLAARRPAIGYTSCSPQPTQMQVFCQDYSVLTEYFELVLLRIKRNVLCVVSARFNTGPTGPALSVQPRYAPPLRQLCRVSPGETVPGSRSQLTKNHFELSVIKEKIPNNISVIMSSVAFYSRGKINIYIIC